MRRALLWLVALLAVASLARPAAAEERTLRERVEAALTAHDLDRAVGELTRSLESVRSPSVLVQGAEASLDLLPRELGGALAVAFARKALELAGARDFADTWKCAMAVRRRVVHAAGDAELGGPFLELLMARYESPEKVPREFRRDLAELYAGASRQEEAQRVYEEILALFPTDVPAARELARIQEDRGELEAAVATLGAALAAQGAQPRGRDARALLLDRAQIRLYSQRRYDLAEADLRAGLEAADRNGSEVVSDDLSAAFERELGSLDRARRQTADVRERLAGVDRALLAALLFVLVTVGAGVGLGRVRGAL